MATKNIYAEFTDVITEGTEWKNNDFAALCEKHGWDLESLEKTIEKEMGMTGQELIDKCRK